MIKEERMDQHNHNHAHAGINVFSDHLFEFRSVAQSRLIISLVITFTVMIVEFMGGFLTNSIALISDAGHMFTHSFAIAISLAAIIIARTPPCHHKTFGMFRAEILAAFINGIFLLLVVGIIVYEAILRIMQPKEVLSLQMLVIALIGLVVNIATIVILHGSHKDDLNVKSVFYHMIGDVASSIGIVAAAVVIYFTQWNILDPLISIGISAVIAIWAYGILKDSGRILLEMAPHGLSVDMISSDIKEHFPQITELNNVHLWTITSGMFVFSAHARLNTTLDPENPSSIMLRLNEYLKDRYHIIESTIQISEGETGQVCASDEVVS